MSERHALIAKLKALTSYCLTHDDYESIDNLNSRHELLAFLRNIPTYKPALERFGEGKIDYRFFEEQLTTSIFYDFVKVNNFLDLDMQQFSNALFAKYELNYIKKVLHNCLDERPPTKIIAISPPCTRLFSFDINKMLEISQKSELFSFLHNTKYSFIVTKIEGTPLLELENMLDISYFTNIFSAIRKISKESDRHDARLVYEARVDTTNISWLWRCKNYFNLPNAMVIENLIPIEGRVRRVHIESLLGASDKRDFVDVLKKTPYKKYYEHLTPLELERAIAVIPYKMCTRLTLANPHSIAHVIKHILRREREVKRIISLIEGKAYSVDTRKMINSWEADNIGDS